jgi:N-glycosylase/DNA lyase
MSRGDTRSPEVIKRRLKEFSTLGKNKWVVFDFNPFLDLKLKATIETELAFCISTANSSALAGLRFQKSLEGLELKDLDVNVIEELLMQAGVRFYTKKAEYIAKAIEKFDFVKSALDLPSFSARKMLIKLKGLGYKEASHFLRNVGRRDVAIIDRHVMRWMLEREYIDKIPKSLTPKRYVELEEILRRIAVNMGLSLAELDLIIWYEMTGKVLK